jgi:soluble lytic murein transglycosylase-like protein
MRYFIALFCIILYPIAALASPWDKFIHQTERALQLPQNLLAAILQFESSFRPKAINTQKPGVAVTSHGLGQLTLDTAAAHCRMRLSDLYNPLMNIRCSAKVLRYQLDRFEDLDYAIAAYNSGTPCVCDGKVYRYQGWHDGEVCRMPRSRKIFSCSSNDEGRFLNQRYVDGIKSLM